MHKWLPWGTLVFLLFAFVKDDEVKVLEKKITISRDTITHSETSFLKLKIWIDPEQISQIGLTKSKSDELLVQFRIEQFEDGYYYLNKSTDRKLYDGVLTFGISLEEGSELTDMTLVYYKGGKLKKLKL